MAAARSSESMDFAVPGSPTSMSARLPARVTTQRSTSARSPMNLAVMSIRAGSSGCSVLASLSSRSPVSPQTKVTTARGVSNQPGGLGPWS